MTAVQRVELRDVSRRRAGYCFDRASIEGSLADEYLIASIGRASGGYGSTDTIEAKGPLESVPSRSSQLWVALSNEDALGAAMTADRSIWISQLPTKQTQS